MKSPFLKRKQTVPAALFELYIYKKFITNIIMIKQFRYYMLIKLFKKIIS